MRADPRAAAIAASLVSVAALLLAVPSLAGAASPPITTQAAAADAAFLAYAPPPAGGARALCLVDTGVNPTPDTAPGLVSATALDGGAANDVDPLTHGTIDAAIAGGAGHGVLGAWPQLKIVSVRATDVPSPGQIPTFGFDDYSRGIKQCVNGPVPGVEISAIALPLSSDIPPTPDQTEEFAAAVNLAQARGLAVFASAGNDPGPIQLPGSQPGVLAVGAGDASNAACSFSATVGLTFYAPGCGIDQIDTRGETFCCGNGTSQASAFAAGVLVALRSYRPDLTVAQAIQDLLTTTRNGHLDAAVAFRAAGLSAIVDAGTAAIPAVGPTVSAPRPVSPSAGTARRVPRPSVKRITWRRGVLEITLNSLPKEVRLHAKITFARRKALSIGTSHLKLRTRMPLPRRVELTHIRGGVSSAVVVPRVTRVR
jgi:Subtilase family